MLGWHALHWGWNRVECWEGESDPFELALASSKIANRPQFSFLFTPTIVPRMLTAYFISESLKAIYSLYWFLTVTSWLLMVSRSEVSNLLISLWYFNHLFYPLLLLFPADLFYVQNFSRQLWGPFPFLLLKKKYFFTFLREITNQVDRHRRLCTSLINLNNCY